MAGLLGLAVHVGHVHDDELDVVAVFFPGRLDVGHLAGAGAAPANPEVQQHRLALEVGQGEGRSIRVGHGEVRGRGGGCVGAVAVTGIVGNVGVGGGIYLGFLDGIGAR